MTEEERAIICAALAFAAADRRDDALWAQGDYANDSRLTRLRAVAWIDRCDKLDALLTAVRRYEEARRGPH